MVANAITPRRKDGSNHIADVGETSHLAGDCYDEKDPGNQLVGSAIDQFRLTLEDEDTGQIINGRDDADIKNTGGGTLNADGTWELDLSAADNAVIDPTKAIEYHIATIRYTYLDLEGDTQDGKQLFRLQVAPGVILVPVATGPVALSGEIAGPLHIGDSYLEANGDAFVWWIAAVPGMTPASLTATFRGNQCCGETDAWSVTGNVTEDATYGLWKVVFEMTTAQTEAIAAGTYDWAVELTESGGKSTVKSGSVDWVCI